MALDIRRIKGILESLDWQGHVELGRQDMNWLANELAAKLTSTDFQRCDSCGAFKEICVPTGLGKMCQDCIDQASEAIETAMEEIEDKKAVVEVADDDIPF